MIIEGAFLKLPELLLGHSFPRSQYEATLTSHLAMGVLLELSARNIELPMHRIHIERPYPHMPDTKSPGRVDLYVDLAGIYTKGLWHNLYGMKSQNWIEAKFFGSIGRSSGTETKTENVAFIALDLLRLCLFVPEERSRQRDNARYFLAVFNRHPSQYLAFRRQSSGSTSTEREWLRLLFDTGEKTIHISLMQEPGSFKRIFGIDTSQNAPELDLKVRVTTRSFVPIEAASEFLYWGYLIRIVDFELAYGNETLIYKDTSQEVWSEEQEQIQRRLLQSVKFPNPQ